ncbi:Acetyl esterase [compost metagenome]
MNKKKVPSSPATRQPIAEAAPPAAVPFPSPGYPTTLRAGQLDRDARNFLRAVNLVPNPAAADKPSPSQLKIVRESFRLAALALGSRPAVASVREREIAGPGGPIVLRIFVPFASKQPLPALLWNFGGGFIVGGLDTGESICRNIALAAGCITVAVNYRRSPEHDISASRADVLAALEWLAGHGAEEGIDTSRLAIGGDSAGGNLSAAVAQEAQRRGGPTLRMQVLVYPATELLERFPSYEENIDGGYFLTREGVDLIEAFLAESIENLDLADPWYSPRRSPDLGGLPPALVLTAGFDPIRDDGLDYAARLRDAGVPVEVLHYAGQFHGFLNFDTLVGAARNALRRIGAALKDAFADAPAVDRTIEIYDDSPTSAVSATAGEVATLALTAWTATVGWRDALLRIVSPKAASACRVVLSPWSVPTAFLRRRLRRHLNRLTEYQTYSGEAPN